MKYDAKLPINVSPDTFDTTNYYILTTDSTPIYFGAGEKLTQDEVTALANTSSTGSGTITINGKTVDPKTIKEIHIGSTYGTVTIPLYFLYGCSNMKTMFLRGLRTTSF